MSARQEFWFLFVDETKSHNSCNKLNIYKKLVPSRRETLLFILVDSSITLVDFWDDFEVTPLIKAGMRLATVGT